MNWISFIVGAVSSCIVALIVIAVWKDEPKYIEMPSQGIEPYKSIYISEIEKLQNKLDKEQEKHSKEIKELKREHTYTITIMYKSGQYQYYHFEFEDDVIKDVYKAIDGFLSKYINTLILSDKNNKIFIPNNEEVVNIVVSKDD